MKIAKLSGCPRYGASPPGTRHEEARSSRLPARQAGVAPDEPGERCGQPRARSRTAAPRRPAVGPISQMKGTWTSAASGIQCPFEAIGRMPSAGQHAADVDEVPDVVELEAAARGERRARRSRSSTHRGSRRPRRSARRPRARRRRSRTAGRGSPCRAQDSMGPGRTAGYGWVTSGYPSGSVWCGCGAVRDRTMGLSCAHRGGR